MGQGGGRGVITGKMGGGEAEGSLLNTWEIFDESNIKNRPEGAWKGGVVLQIMYYVLEEGECGGWEE